MDWEKAKKRLDEVRMMYTEIGAAGLIALRMFINPLLVRYEKGERTEELYSAIMALE